MTCPVFVNEQRLTVVPGTSIRDVLRLADPAWVDALDLGRARLTDGRGIPLDPAEPAAAGAIIRIVISAKHHGDRVDADA